MIYTNHPVIDSLSRHVGNIFHFKDFIPNHEFERVVPSGSFFIILELDGFTRYLLDNETLNPYAKFSKAWISGLHKNFITISTHKHSEMMIIQFNPGGIFPFLHIPAEELNDKVVPTEDIFNGEILKLRDKVKQKNSTSEMFSLIEDWLLQRFKPELDTPKSIFEVLRIMENEPLEINYKHILKLFPYSQKHLINLFKKYVGLTPKYYQRILRFNEILHKIQKEEKISWTQIAYSCNYTDQSHFIKDFKHFSGFNPTEYIESDYHKGDTNFFPLEEGG